jgi:tight adherence protein C
MIANSAFALFGDTATTMLSVLVFLAVGMLTFALMVGMRAREAVRRRAVRVGLEEEAGAERRSLRYAGIKAAHKLIDYATKHYASAGGEDVKMLRQRLVQAGIYNPRAAAYFFFARLMLAIGLAVVLFLGMQIVDMGGRSSFWLLVLAGGVCGYLAPSFYVDRQIAAKREEHRSGFPDLMDLMVVCADAGLAMEASLDRIGRELSDSYPSLAANIHMANLEIRAGRSVTEALEHLGDRLGLEEARSFAALIQQSDELGSSISDALRVYSDDMRHKRLSRAEEKAYALPAKLSVPMMVCIFPVLFIVILLPVIVRMATGHW